MKISRPGALTTAAVLLGLVSLLSLATPPLRWPAGARESVRGRCGSH